MISVYRLINWRGLHRCHYWPIHLYWVYMLRFALGLLYFLRFHVVFLFVKSYVGRKICALASHLHVFVSSQRGAVKILVWGGGGGGVRLKDFRTGEGLPIWGWGSFCFGVSTPLHAIDKIYCSGAVTIVLEKTWNNSLTDEVESPSHWQMNLAIL